MMFLIPESYHEDESLEIFLLRISHANFFDTYSLFSGAMKDYLRGTDHTTYDSFPLELGRVNIYHAQHSSTFRVRAILLVEQMLGVKQWRLYTLALKHSASKMAGNYSAVTRQKVVLPIAFLRKECIPVCPECLLEDPYIRQSWHYRPYVACHKHKVKLIERCPKCGEPLNYQREESISRCICGADLTEAKSEMASEHELQLSSVFIVEEYAPQSDSQLLKDQSNNARIGALLWYCLRQGKPLDNIEFDDEFARQCVTYFQQWPYGFYSDLNNISERAESLLVKPFNKSPFSSVFGNLLRRSRTVTKEQQEDFVHQAIVKFITDLVAKNPKSKIPNIADLMLTVPEAAALLGCSLEQVYRYYEQGMLECSFRPRLYQKVSMGKPAFFLRQVAELKLGLGDVGEGLPAW